MINAISNSRLSSVVDTPEPENPRVSVVMAVYNASRFLREAIDSVLEQTFQNFELIIVDDASSDDSLAIIKNLKDRRLRVICHARNLGAAESRNDALAIARGDLIAIMDADDVAMPTRLEKQVNLLDAHSEVGVVGCGIYESIDTSGAVLGTSILPIDNATLQESLIERWCFLHPSIVFRKRLYEIVGGYRSAFEPAEDHDLLLRMMEHTEARNLNECLMKYRVNPRSLSVKGQQYINELGEIAMRIARRRRAGESERVENETAHITALKEKRKGQNRVASTLQEWGDSFYAASRYYGFGCRELCAGHLTSARRCYVQALRTNALFTKAWLGVGLSLMPFAARRLRFVFRASMQKIHSERWFHPPVETAESSFARRE